MKQKTIPPFLSNYPISEHEKQIVDFFGGYPALSADIIGATARISRKRKRVPTLGTIILCFTNRAGSYLFSEGLSNCSNAAFGGEYFNHNFVINFCLKKNITTFSDYCIKLRKRALRGKNFFCTKLGFSQLFFLTKLGVFPHLFPEPRFVLIKRRDLLGQAISLSIASQTGLWTSKQEGDGGRVEFDAADIVNKMQQIVNANGQFEKYFALTGEPYVKVFYEDMVSDFAETMKSVIPRLGLKMTSAPDLSGISFKKQRTTINSEFASRIRRMCSIRALMDGTEEDKGPGAEEQ